MPHRPGSPPDAAPTTAPLRPSLWDRSHLPFAVGAVALVTLGAFENRAVSTVLPVVARQLDGLWLFGAASAAPLVSFVVATTIAGTWSDRRGPVPVLYAGMGLFVSGELLMGLAPAMPVFVAGRLVGGLAEGLLDVGLTVLVARALPAQLRPRIFATFAAAWVLPSLLGPSVAGVIAERVHWRAVFLLGIALLVPVWVCLRPALGAARRSAPTRAPAPSTHSRIWHSAAWSLAAAGSLTALTAGAALAAHAGTAGTAGGVLVVGSLSVLVPALRALLPRGTLTAARGIPALTALRGLLGAAFGTTGAFLPLMLAEVLHYGPAAAGVSLTLTGIFWAAGSQLQGLGWVQQNVTVAARLRVGFGLLTLGLAGPAFLATGALSAWVGLGLWAVAGIGIGICSPTISHHVLTLSSERDQGSNSAASILAPSVSQAVALAVAGGAVALAAPHLTGALFGAIMGGAALLGLAGLVLAPRACAPTSADVELAPLRGECDVRAVV